MFRRALSWRPSHTTVAAYLALFIALGGTSYAAVKLPKNSVGSGQIKKNAVSSSKVKNGSLTKSDFRASDLPVGPAGAQGPKGDKGDRGDNGTNGVNGTNGAPGTAKAFARIDSAGNLIGGAAQAKGITQAMIQHENTPATGDANTSPTGIGVYCLGGLGFDVTSAHVALDNTDSMPAIGSLTGGTLNMIPSAAIFKGEDLGRCNSEHGQVRVAIEQVNDSAVPTLANHGFYVWLEG
jgi:hypothetical protein